MATWRTSDEESRLSSRRIRSSKRARQVVWLITFQIGSMSGSASSSAISSAPSSPSLPSARSNAVRTSLATAVLPKVAL